MESLESKKFAVLNEEELQMIEGGGLWNKWKVEISADGCVTWEERHNWFGLHATGDTRNEKADC